MTYLQGITFPEQNVTPSDDARLYNAVGTDGILSGCAMSTVGATFYLESGSILAAGRNIRVPSSQTFAVTGATSGYARLLLTIDLTQSATQTNFQQASVDIEYSASLDGFASLVQDNINAGGTTYQLVLAVMAMTAVGIGSIVRQVGPAHARGRGVRVTLPADGWGENIQTVPVIGATADDNVNVVLSPDPEINNWNAYNDAGIRCTKQGDGTLTFFAADVPAVDVRVNVLFS